MVNRSARATMAKQTLDILEKGHYQSPSGHSISIRFEIEHTVENAVLYRPDDFDAAIETSLARTRDDGPFDGRTEVINTTTLAAAHALVVGEGVENVLCLNFASARNPGGGFMGGSQAQEESLARSSALYLCQQRHFEMYRINRAHRSCLYTDHMIYAPAVPIFRNDKGELLDAPYTAAILTAPAVNAGATKGKDRQKIAATMLDRTGKVLAVASAHGHKTLVLGAWGCGVFRNDPEQVAGGFLSHLGSGGLFEGAFDRVVFAVLDRGKQKKTLAAFESRFGRA